MWTLARNRSVYVVEHAGSDRGYMCIETVDEDRHHRTRGLEPDEILTYSNGVRKEIYRNPDGNEVGFGGAPANSRS